MARLWGIELRQEKEAELPTGCDSVFEHFNAVAPVAASTQRKVEVVKQRHQHPSELR